MWLKRITNRSDWPRIKIYTQIHTHSHRFFSVVLFFARFDNFAMKCSFCISWPINKLTMWKKASHKIMHMIVGCTFSVGEITRLINDLHIQNQPVEEIECVNCIELWFFFPRVYSIYSLWPKNPSQSMHNFQFNINFHWFTKRWQKEKQDNEHTKWKKNVTANEKQNYWIIL